MRHAPSPRRRTLSGRLSVFMLGTTFLVLLVAQGATLGFALLGFQDGQLHRAEELAEIVAILTAQSLPDQDAVEQTLDAFVRDRNFRWALYQDRDGRAVAWCGPVPEHILANRPDDQQPGRAGRVTMGGHDVLAQGKDQGRVLVGVLEPFRPHAVVPMAAGLVGVLLAGMGLSCLAVWYLRRRVLIPLDNLGRAMIAVARGEDGPSPLEHAARDEIGDVVAAFNTMQAEVRSRDRKLRARRERLESMVLERTRQLALKQDELSKRNRRLSEEIVERRKAEMIRQEIERINRHDLKSALNLVTGYPELMLEMGGLTERQRMYLEIIRDTGYRIMNQIKNQLDLFRLEKGLYHMEFQQVDLLGLLRELEGELGPLLVRREAGLEITLDGKRPTDEDRVLVCGERTLLATMIRNLLVNAVEAARPGEALQVAVYHGSRVRLAIRNQEPVPEDIRHRFFDKYVTHGKQSGTGLGTYSAKLIAAAHGARITLRTGEKIGTLVRVAFAPVVPAEGNAQAG